jgi:hypothetical protein
MPLTMMLPIFLAYLDLIEVFLHLGLMKLSSMQLCRIEFVDDITRNIDAGKQTDCLIMDFSKAFDKVTHSLLQHKLDHYDIRGKTGNIAFFWMECR